MPCLLDGHAGRRWGQGLGVIRLQTTCPRLSEARLGKCAGGRGPSLAPSRFLPHLTSLPKVAAWSLRFLCSPCISCQVLHMLASEKQTVEIKAKNPACPVCGWNLAFHVLPRTSLLCLKQSGIGPGWSHIRSGTGSTEPSF